MDDSNKNVANYRKGKEPLKNAVMQHPDGNEIHDYVKGKIERNFWVIPFKDWTKKQKLRK